MPSSDHTTGSTHNTLHVCEDKVLLSNGNADITTANLNS